MAKRIKKIIESYIMADKNASFQERWLVDVMNQCQLKYSGLAKILHVSTTAISFYINNRSKLTYCTIYTICKKLELADDPDEIYSKIMSEKE